MRAGPTLEAADAAGREDRAEARVAAPPEAVFAAWTRPAAVADWLPPEGARAEIEAFDLRPGGAFHMVLHFPQASATAKSGPDSDRILARFVAVEPPHRLAFDVTFDSPRPEFAGVMRMTWTFSPDGPHTRVRVAATGVPPGIDPADHAAGLAASLRQLARHVEHPSPTHR